MRMGLLRNSRLRQYLSVPSLSETINFVGLG